MSTPAEDQILKVFETKVRHLLIEYGRLKRENEALKLRLESSEQQAKTVEQKISAVQKDFGAYKMAKMMEVSDGDLDSARSKLSKLIRDVNKCIAVLTDKVE